jgi:hypothetical protein
MRKIKMEEEKDGKRTEKSTMGNKRLKCMQKRTNKPKRASEEQYL